MRSRTKKNLTFLTRLPSCIRPSRTFDETEERSSVFDAMESHLHSLKSSSESIPEYRATTSNSKFSGPASANSGYLSIQHRRNKYRACRGTFVEDSKSETLYCTLNCVFLLMTNGRTSEFHGRPSDEPAPIIITLPGSPEKERHQLKLCFMKETMWLQLLENLS